MYVMREYQRIPILKYLQKLEGATTIELKDVIVILLKSYLVVDHHDIAEKLVCFAANRVALFQGAKTRVTKKLQAQSAPYLIEVHCMVLRTNPVAKALANLSFVTNIEKLVTSLHSYFRAYPKRHLELTKLVGIVETEGLKILHCVRMHSISTLQPSKCMLGEYKTFIIKLLEDVAFDKKKHDTT